MARGQKTAVPAIVLLFIIGLGGLSVVMRRPEFQTYRAVDVVQLLGSGLCFGVGFALLIVKVWQRQS
ncbi:MAG TPA: hypothetical protein VLY23_03615 [Candidatus Acidoferrum sp.]|nr:hypothetical protein [Candidatus Acidoferrum sp.]